MDDDSTCEKEQALIMAIIKKKYGEIIKNPLSSRQVIIQGNRAVSTECRGLFDVRLIISYLDTKLSELAENERIELESSNVDSSGL